MISLGWILLGGLLMSLISLVGAITTLLPPAVLERLLLPLVSLAAGTLLGGALLHMLPEAIAAVPPLTAGLCLLAGFTVFLALELALSRHHGPAAHGGLAQRVSARRVSARALAGGARRRVFRGSGLRDGWIPGSAAVAGGPRTGLCPGGSKQAPAPAQALPPSAAPPVRAPAQPAQPVAVLILLGDGLHNFIGGLSIASTFLLNPSAGILAWCAAAAHEVPQELGDFGVLVHSGWSRRRALTWNLISALTFPLGAVLAWLMAQAFDVAELVLFGAGNFLYIAASDLVPEIRQRSRPAEAAATFGWFAGGLLLMLLPALRLHRG